MKPSSPTTTSLGHRCRQRGMVSILAAFLLIVGVVFILAQTYGLLSTRAVDTSEQLDSTAALMLAESGLQRAQAIIGTAANASLASDSVCTGIGAGGPFVVGRGSFSYGTSVSYPVSCGTTTLCDSCTVSVTGTVGEASRSLTQVFNYGVSVGVAGRGTTVTMVLKNTYDVPATSLFNMAWKRQDPGGNADATFCSNGAPDCGLQWNLESSNGNTSIGGMGVTVGIPAYTASKFVVQNISQARDYVEVGALFPSTSTTTTPTISGSYWDDKHGGGGASARLTAVNNGDNGAVTNGVFKGPSGTCSSSPTTYPSGGAGSFQADTCTSWCGGGTAGGGDTLVFGVSGRPSPGGGSSADQLTAVTFNTSGTPAQNILMTRVVHFPNLNGTTPNASGKAYSEIWYAYNPDYNSGSGGLGAISYSAAASVTVGATVTLSSNISSGDTTATISSLSGSPICIGDRLDAVSGVISSPAGCYSAGTTITFSAATGNANKSNLAVSTKSLQVVAATGTLTAGSTSNAGITIASGSGNSYTLTDVARVTTATTITQGSTSSTIRVPMGTDLPIAGTRLAVYSKTATGTGKFPAGAIVQSVDSANYSFTVSGGTPGVIAGSEALLDATICGGTCAMFNNPSNNGSKTTFTVTRSANTQQWAGGFICLKGVDGDRITAVTSTSLTTGRWQEPVQ